VVRRAKTAVRIISYRELQMLIVRSKAMVNANHYRRFSGEVVSSRQAQDFLDGKTRSGTKSHLIARALAKLTGAAPDNTHVFASGMAAVTSVIRTLPGLANGKKTLQLEFPYVDCLKVQELFGHGVVYLNQAVGESFDEALKRIREGKFAGAFTKVPSDPILRAIDLARVSKACAEGSEFARFGDRTVGIDFEVG
jgi:cystathionine gamma-synthase